MDNNAMRTILHYVSDLRAGKAADIFGYIPDDKKGTGYKLSPMSHRAPKIHFALQYLVRNFFRVSNVIAVGLAKAVQRVPKC
eukprot:236313-Lingulodinium_polyedra.AAC.1